MVKQTKRPFMIAVDSVMKLSEEYMDTNNGYTNGIGKHVSSTMNMKLTTVFAYRHFGNFLKDNDLYDVALEEQWGRGKVTEIMSEFKKTGKR